MRNAQENDSELGDIGSTVGGYRLVWPLGRGGMGEVWLAQVEGTMGMQKLVALKMIMPEIADGARFRRLFLDEARVAAWISHPNVVSVLRIGDDNGKLFYLMDWVEGGAVATLRQACEDAGETIPPGIAARIVADTCVGLHAVHEARGPDGAPLGVVHRDVSPQNILLTEDGIPRVADFGVSKARLRLSDATQPGALMGKRQYASPEQWACTAVDRRADIWGAGAVLYHLVVGHPPVPVSSTETGQNAMRARREALTSRVPAAIAEVVERALEPECEGRFSTALEMSLALERALSASGLSTLRADVAAFAAQRLAEQRRAQRDGIARALATVYGASVEITVRGEGHREASTSTRKPETAERPTGPQLDGPPLFEGSATGTVNRPAQDAALPFPPQTNGPEATREGARSGENIATVVALSGPAPRRPWSAKAIALVIAIAALIAFSARAGRRVQDAPPPQRLTATATERTAIVDPPPPSPPPVAQEPTPTKEPNNVGRRAPLRTPVKPRPVVVGPGEMGNQRSRDKQSTACSPPYTIDVDGFRKYKVECL